MVRILSFCDNVFAKDDGKTTLKDHIYDCNFVLNYLISTYRKPLYEWANRNNIDFDWFIESVKKSVHYHDFGKATLKWQEEARKENTKLPYHSPYAGYFILQEVEVGRTDNTNDFVPVLATVSHHSLLTENSWRNTPVPDEFIEGCLREINKEFGYCELDFTKNWSGYLNNLRKFRDNSQQHRSIFGKVIDTRFKSKYSLILSLITTSDNIASYFEENNVYDEDSRLKELKNRFPPIPNITKILETLEEGKSLFYTQKKIIKLGRKQNNPLRLLFEAPCGEGKTLASLLYARELFKRGKINRVIFTLPTQTTTNNMMLEFEKDYNIPKQWIGIYHSEVFHFLLEENRDLEEEDLSSLKSIKYWSNFYGKPFNVSTVDHLLLSLVNGYKYAPRAFGNLQTSLVVIDELHYYDSHTIGMIKCLCKILSYLGIPHILMTATMPRNVKGIFEQSFFEERIKPVTSEGIDEETKKEKRPFIFEYYSDQIIDKNSKLNSNLIEILEKNKEHFIGIITNTVEKSKQVHQKINDMFPDVQTLLYNSEFMKKDRPIKERILKLFSKLNKKMGLSNEDLRFLEEYGFDPDSPLIFIGTQVVEISLNISFDVIISDIAPLDSIIQRSGRIHRSQADYRSDNCNCKQCSNKPTGFRYILHIFDTGDKCLPYTNGKDNIQAEIVNRTKKEILKEQKYSFKTGKKMMNNVFDIENLYDFDEEYNFKQPYIQDLIFGKTPSDRYGPEDSSGSSRYKTRVIETQKMNVLPSTFKINGTEVSVDEFINDVISNKIYCRNSRLTEKGKNEILKNFIQVSHGKYDSRIEEVGDMHVRVVNASYSFEHGLTQFEIENVI